MTIEQLADAAFEEARGGNINYWTIDKDDPEVKLWKDIWMKGFKAGKEGKDKVQNEWVKEHGQQTQ